MFLKNIIKKINAWNFVFGAAVVLYFIFYAPYIFGGNIIKSGDAESLHYPGIYYLKERISQGSFPFYSERIFSGFPVYENSEFAYLNPLRIVFSLVFSPVWVLKVEHILFFILGTVGMYLLAKKLKFSPAGFLFSHTVYFYSIQSVARFTHTNIIYVYFLLPLCLYFLQNFLEKKDKRGIFFLALVNAAGIYYGNYNAVLISVMIQLIYYFCFAPGIQKKEIKKQLLATIKFFTLLLIWVLVLSLPIIITSGALYITSARGTGGISYAQGSVSGLYLLINLLHPYPFGFGDSYIGDDVKNTWLFHENSIYTGISVLIVSLAGALFLKDKKFKYFYAVNFILFILLSTINYSPIGKFFNIFPISLFRYWVRYSVAFHFASALLGGALISGFERVSIREKKALLKNTLFVVVPLGILIYLTIYNIKAYTSTVLIDYLVSVFPGGILHKRILAVIAFSSVIFLFLYLKKRKTLFAYLLAIIACFDVVYFSHMALLYKLEPARDLINQKIMETSKVLENERVVYLDKNIKGNTPLYYKTWGIFGYSISFEQADYTKFLDRFEMSSRRFKEFKPDYLSEFGTKAFVYEDGTYKVLDGSENLLFSGSGIEADIKVKKEGEFSVVVKNSLKDAQTVETKVRNFPGWRIWVNGREEKFSSQKGDVFLNFMVGEGTSLIKMKYFPIHLFYSIPITLFGLAAVYFVHKSLKF